MENIIVKLKQTYMTKEVEMIIEDGVHNVTSIIDYRMPTINGILDKEQLQAFKTLVMNHATEYLADSLVTTSQEYPENESSLVTFKLNCVILTKADYNKLIKNIK